LLNQIEVFTFYDDFAAMGRGLRGSTSTGAGTMREVEQTGSAGQPAQELTAADLDQVTGGKGGGGDSDGFYYESAIGWDGYYQNTAYGSY
jgi:hypothetical protein